jgi:hypothetical protein
MPFDWNTTRLEDQKQLMVHQEVSIPKGTSLDSNPILVCLYGTAGSIWNKYGNVRVFEEINRLSREILLKTKDVVQKLGYELI